MFLVYLVTGLALILHVLSHMIPILIVLHAQWLESIVEHPITTCIALSFIPLSVYHLWKDGQMHQKVHDLTKERDRLIARLKEQEPSKFFK